MPIRPLLRFLAAALALACGAAQADGLSDLKSALARLQAQTPVRATLEVRTIERHGEGADAREKQGQASVQVEDGARGLQVTWARDTVARLDAESRALGRDPKAKTPTTWALSQLDSTEVAPLVSAVTTLSRAIEDATFKGERVDAWDGKAARLLSFAIPVTRVPEDQRKYIKEFDGLLEIWIGADGTPLASATRADIKGRAFVVVSFDAKDETRTTYGVVGDRLVTLRTEHHATSSGAGERGDRRIVKTLQPLS
jgi:hypothetical protein